MTRYTTLGIMPVALCSAIAITAVAHAQSNVEEEVLVIGVTPTQGSGLPPEQIPYPVQTISDEQLRDSHALDFSDYAARRLQGVITNEAQNNRLQPDVIYRGFTASPLLGLPQGISIYQNGVRVNEPLGDTVNWDLIPTNAIESIDLIGGANPVFGLNTLGGALSLKTKTGFSDPGYGVSLEGGSFSTRQLEVHAGDHNDTLGYFVTTSYFAEDGWRDASGSELKNLFASGSYRRDGFSADLNYTYADSELIGNGTIPELLRELEGSERVFTSPDETTNALDMFNLQTSYELNDDMLFSANAFYRNNDTGSFNGDGSEFEQCEDDSNTAIDEAEQLCADDSDEAIEDQNGDPIAEQNADDEERDAIENISEREQQSYGGTLQGVFKNALMGRDNQLTAGLDYYRGEANFVSEVRIATLTDQRSTATETLADGSAIYVPEEGTALETSTRTYGIYLSDTYQFRDDWYLTLSGRYNRTEITLRDRGGQVGHTVRADDNINGRSRLDGDHTYTRFNPAIGLTHTRTIAHSDTTFYTNYSEASRAPSPVELACADPRDPCSLPNAFLADPPLEEVTTRTTELGARGVSDVWQWHIGGYFTVSSDDIIFQSVGGVQSNEGFFANIDETQRLGLDISVSGEWEQFSWTVSYNYLRATYEDDFSILSANHPLASTDNNTEGEIRVEAGDRLPGIPEHSFKNVLAYRLSPTTQFSVETLYYSDRYLRGDESNDDEPLGGYALFNFLMDIDINEHTLLFVRVDNLLDREYATFGLYGEADEVLNVEVMGENIYEGQSRFVSPGTPRAYYVGINLRF